MSAPPRCATVMRRTNETEINLTLTLDGQGQSKITTGVGFFDHALDHVTRHGLFDLTLAATGDYHIDDHHTVEDVGILLGKAFGQALGSKAGIRRYGHAIVPMDEALALVACDFSGRGLLVFQGEIPTPKVGSFDTELVPEFLRALAANAGLTLHVQILAGRNSHHIIEGIFKALGQALRDAVALDPRREGQVPSTKGVLE